MKITKKQAEQNRRQILAAAKQLCRQRGIDASGVSEVMAAAGFTHGGFYGHFESKQDLMAQACAATFDDKTDLWTRELEPGDAALKALGDRYLTESHCKNSGTACPMAVLASDAARGPGPVQRAYTSGVDKLFETLASKLGKAKDAAARKRAIHAWSLLVGAFSIARAVDDPKLAAEILRAAREGMAKV